MTQPHAPLDKRSQRPGPGWMWALYLTPALLTAGYIAVYGVNVPVLDEWGLPYLFYMLKTGGYSFGQLFWPPNNEHRVVLPKLIWAALAFPTHWNLLLNMFITLAVMLGAFVGMVRSAVREHSGRRATLHAAVLASAILLFSFEHLETWLFTYGFTFVLAICLAIAAMLVLGEPGLHPLVRLWIAVALCFLSTFSSGQGIFAWVAMLPAVLFAFPSTRQRVIACLSVMACFALTMSVYWIDYHPDRTFSPDPMLLWRHPIQVLLFWLALVGAPLSQASCNPAQVAPWFGAASLASLAVAMFAAIRNRILPRVAVWISLGTYGVGVAAMVAVKRAAWGVGVAAVTSRYMIHAVLIQVALLFLLAGLASRKRAWRPALWSTAIVIAGVEILSYPSFIERARELHDARTMAAQALEIMPYIDPATDQMAQGLLFPLFPLVMPVSYVRTPAELLYRAGLRWIEHNAVFDEHPAFCGCLDSPALRAGESLALGKSDALPVSGWAVYPGSTSLPKMVFFSTGDRRVFVFGTKVGTINRPDVGTLVKNQALSRSGWSAAVPAALLPVGDFEVKAWIYDRKHSRFLRLATCNGPNRIVRFN